MTAETRHLGTFLSCRQLGIVLKARIDQLRKAHLTIEFQSGMRFPYRRFLAIWDYSFKSVPNECPQ